MLDLVNNGSSFDEVVTLAKHVEAAGASIINTGIGWHEARIPTIATMVPRGAFAWVTKKMKGQINIPLCTTNRINKPEIAEDILQNGYADMVSMARYLPIHSLTLFIHLLQHNLKGHFLRILTLLIKQKQVVLMRSTHVSAATKLALIMSSKVNVRRVW